MPTQTVLSSNELLHKAVDYEVLRPWLGLGLLTNGGENWHAKRKLLTPAFHFNILSSFKAPMDDCCNILIQRLADVANSESVDIVPYIKLFTLDVISGENSNLF